MKATCSHPVAEVTVFSKQRARRRPSHEVAVGNLNPPGMADGAKDFGAVLVAWWLIPSNSTNLVVELR